MYQLMKNWNKNVMAKICYSSAVRARTRLKNIVICIHNDYKIRDNEESVSIT